MRQIVTPRDGALGYPTPAQAAARVRYTKCVSGVSVALALLAYWDRPWSGSAKRFAYHALRYAWSRGLDVLQGL